MELAWQVVCVMSVQHPFLTYLFFLQIFKFSGKRQHYSLGTQFVVMTWRVCEINEKLQNYAKSSWFSVFSLRLRSRLGPVFLEPSSASKLPLVAIFLGRTVTATVMTTTANRALEPFRTFCACFLQIFGEKAALFTGHTVCCDDLACV